MRTTARRHVLGLLLVLAGTGAHAQDTVSPQRMGEFLGLVLMCECLPYESGHQQIAFYAMMSEAYGARYADTATGYMRGAMSGDYRNTATVCQSHVCANDYTHYLDEVMAMTQSEPEEYLAQYAADYPAPSDDAEAAGEPAPTWCAFKPFHPQCRALP